MNEGDECPEPVGAWLSFRYVRKSRITHHASVPDFSSQILVQNPVQKQNCLVPLLNRIHIDPVSQRRFF
jgi:hypothetical protein